MSTSWIAITVSFTYFLTAFGASLAHSSISTSPTDVLRSTRPSVTGSLRVMRSAQRDNSGSLVNWWLTLLLQLTSPLG